jgi:hypothetical protein
MRTKKALAGMTDFVAFEELCCALLCSYGQYQGIIPQGAGRVDGGKDALLIHWDFKGDGWASTMIDKKVFHFSLRKDVKAKLKEDLKKVKKNYPNPTHVVFVTSQLIPPTKRDNLIKEAKKKYGWNLEILEQSFFCPPLDTQYIRLRKEYLGIKKYGTGKKKSPSLERPVYFEIFSIGSPSFFIAFVISMALFFSPHFFSDSLRLLPDSLHLQVTGSGF